MSVRFWQEKEQEVELKRYVRLRTPPPEEGSAIAFIVNENGEKVPGGFLLRVNADGTLDRCRCVDSEEAARAGIQLDDIGRWKLEY